MQLQRFLLKLYSFMQYVFIALNQRILIETPTQYCTIDVLLEADAKVAVALCECKYFCEQSKA